LSVCYVDCTSNETPRYLNYLNGTWPQATQCMQAYVVGDPLRKYD
jgi:hypothetical protein